MSTKEIFRIQKALKQEGFDPGKIDGIWGPKTEKAYNDWKEFTSRMLKILDVSRWQTKVDWQIVKNEGVVGVYIKATDGLGKDPLYDQHKKNAKAAGLLVGSYHFFRPNRDLVAQADNVLKVVGQLGKGDLPIAIDVERDNSGVDGIEGTKDDIVATDAMMEHFANLIESRTGKRPIMYSYGPYFYSHKIDVPTCPLWIADYRNGPPTTYGSWPHYTLHQYIGDEGRLNGVSGPVDISRFRGTLDDLHKLAGLK